MIIASVAALFFLFNAGQLSSEKTKLVNTADAVAYSVGVVDARTLNFLAYTNRAMLANTVAIAQLVSVSSWAAYLDQLSQSPWLYSWEEEFFGAMSAWYAAEYMGETLNQALNDSGVLEQLAKQSDQTFIKKVLVNAQKIAYSGVVPTELAVMDKVAEANYRNDGTVEVKFLPLATSFHELVSSYSDDDRTRFAEVAKASAKADGFVKHRSWMMVGYPSECYSIPNWIDRRGGTELIGFDEWKALDALSEKKWFVYWGICGIAELPGGYAATVAADETAADYDPMRYDMAKLVVPFASMLAENSSASWGYTGLPKFYDLSEDFLDGGKKESELVIRYAFGLKRKIAETRTSEGASQIRSSGADNRLAQTLNNYQAAPVDANAITAASAVEVYFERGSDNPYGSSNFGKPREIASLFNPFWHVHLVAPSAAERIAAQGSAKAVLP